MTLLSHSAFYLVNKNDPTALSACYLLSVTFSYLVNKNDATVTFSLLLSQ